MIIVRAPLRIPLGGGGTDLPSYYSRFGGSWVSAAVNKYIYIVLHQSFKPDEIKISYSKTEIVKSLEEISHPLFRESLKLLGIKGGIEISSFADAPANAGLGSSGAFCVALLYALHVYLKRTEGKDMPSRKEIAEQACNIAMNILDEPSGKQDEYVSAFGGINSFMVNYEGEVGIDKEFSKKITSELVKELEANLLMFFTGIQRESRSVLEVQKRATENNEAEIIDNLHKVKEIGFGVKQAIENKNLLKLGELMDLHWREKIKRCGTSNERINEWYNLARENGAGGGKLMGAGGGGFLLFYCDGKKDALRSAMKSAGLTEHNFHFDFEGVKILADFI